MIWFRRGHGSVRSLGSPFKLKFGRALLAACSLLLLFSPVAQSQPADHLIAGGWFFTQTGGDTEDPTDGYSVVDDPDARFWTAFREFGGIQAVGYPVTQRFLWDGFVTQVFQKAAFQWRADTGNVEFINVFDDLSHLGFDDALEVRLIPRQEQFDEEDLDFDEIIARRTALLDSEPALRARYDSVSDPLRFFGLPQSGVRVYGDGLLHTVRLQRAVLQLWTEDVPWADAGTVTVANGGEEAKALGLWPEDATLPIPPSSELEETDPRAIATRLLAESATAHAQVVGYVFEETLRQPAPGNVFLKAIGRLDPASGLSKIGVVGSTAGIHADYCLGQLEFDGLHANLEAPVTVCPPLSPEHFVLTGNAIYKFNETGNEWDYGYDNRFWNEVVAPPGRLLETALTTDPTSTWTEATVTQLTTAAGDLNVIFLQWGFPGSTSNSGRSIRIAIGRTDRLIRSVSAVRSYIPIPCTTGICTLAIRNPEFDSRAVEFSGYALGDDGAAAMQSDPLEGTVTENAANPPGIGGSELIVSSSMSLPSLDAAPDAMAAIERFRWLAIHTGGNPWEVEFDLHGDTAAFIGPAILPAWSPEPALSIFSESPGGGWKLATQTRFPYWDALFPALMSVSVADDVIAVGVPHGTSPACSDQEKARMIDPADCYTRLVGAAYLATNYDGDWSTAEPIVKLNHPAIEPSATFGDRVAASNETVVVIENWGRKLYGFSAGDSGWQNGYSTFELKLPDSRLEMTDIDVSEDGSTIAVAATMTGFSGRDWPFLPHLRKAGGWLEFRVDADFDNGRGKRVAEFDPVGCHFSGSGCGGISRIFI